MGNPSQSYGASLAVWDHTVLSATWHKWMRPAVTPARQASTWFISPEGMEGWVDLRSLIADRPGIKPTTARSQVRRPNYYTTESPSSSSSNIGSIWVFWYRRKMQKLENREKPSVWGRYARSRKPRRKHRLGTRQQTTLTGFDASSDDKICSCEGKAWHC